MKVPGSTILLIASCICLLNSASASTAAQNSQPVTQRGRTIPGILAPINAPTSAVAPPQTLRSFQKAPPLAPETKWHTAPPAPGTPITLARPAPTIGANGPAIICKVPVRSLAGLVLNDSVAVISGKQIEIRAASDDSSMIAPAFHGVVIKADAPESMADGERELTGLALFTGGNLFLELGNRGGEDMVFRNEGTVMGEVIGHNLDALVMRQRDGQRITVPLTSVNYIRSPRAFLFTLTGRPVRDKATGKMMRTQVDAITFQPTFIENLTRSTPTSILPEKKYDEYDDSEDEPSGFAVTSSQSRYSPALGNPVFDNNRPLGMQPRRIP